MTRICTRLIKDDPNSVQPLAPRYLDITAIDTPSLALANAVRETLRMGDVLEQMLLRFKDVLEGNKQQKHEVSLLEDEIDMLYSAIKLYLAQIQQDELGDIDSRRWAEIIDTAVNLQQAGEIIGHMTADFAAKSLNARKRFSAEGFEELNTLHTRLVANLDLGMSVFLSSDINNAKRLRRAKHRFRLLNRRYSHAHVERLHQQNVQSIETSSLHMGLLADMKRLNSLFCSTAYHVLEVQEEPLD
jgi:phosphate:Na+ symporter